MAQKLPLARVIADHADLVGGQFVQLAQVVKDHARSQKVGVEEGIDLADGAGGAQHRRGVVQKPSALGVVQLRGGGVVEQAVARLLQTLEYQRLEFAVGDGVHAVEDEIHHLA